MYVVILYEHKYYITYLLLYNIIYYHMSVGYQIIVFIIIHLLVIYHS